MLSNLLFLIHFCLAHWLFCYRHCLIAAGSAWCLHFLDLLSSSWEDPASLFSCVIFFVSQLFSCKELLACVKPLLGLSYYSLDVKFHFFCWVLSSWTSIFFNFFLMLLVHPLYFGISSFHLHTCFSHSKHSQDWTSSDTILEITIG